MSATSASGAWTACRTPLRDRERGFIQTEITAARQFLPLTPAVCHVLLPLVDGQQHGYAILKEIAERTDGHVELSTGTLYGIVNRLLADGVIRESARDSTERRRAYALTAFGKRRRAGRGRTTARAARAAAPLGTCGRRGADACEQD